MIVDTEKLETIRTYAEKLGLTTAAVYSRIRNGAKDIRVVDIKGIKFILVDVNKSK